jgi:hypothetical protein
VNIAYFNGSRNEIFDGEKTTRQNFDEKEQVFGENGFKMGSAGKSASSKLVFGACRYDYYMDFRCLFSVGTKTATNRLISIR